MAREAEGKEDSLSAIMQLISFGVRSQNVLILFNLGIIFFQGDTGKSCFSPPPRIIRALHLTNFSLIQSCGTLVMSQVSATHFLVHIIVMIL